MTDNSQTEKAPPGLVRLCIDREKTKAKIRRYQQRLRDINLVIHRLEEDREKQRHVLC